MAEGVAAASREAMLNAYARGTSYSGNAAVWVKQHTADPGAAGATAPAGETTRQQLTFGSAAAAGAISNTAATTWTNVSTAETWSWGSLWTASTAGTFLGNVTWAVARTVAIGDNVTIAIGDFDITTTGA
jgi:hypothetical protein